MKKRKNKMALFAVALLFAFAFAPAVKAQEVKRDINRAMDDTRMDNHILQNLQNYGAEDDDEQTEKKPYAGGAVTGLRQIAATETAVTLAWQPATGAVGYLVILQDIAGNILSQTPVTETSLTVTVTTGFAYATVIPADANNFDLIPVGENMVQVGSSSAFLVVATVPSQITGVRVYDVFANTYNLRVAWDDAVCEGFEAVCYNRGGQQVDIIDTTEYCSGTFYRTNTQNVYSVKVKGYTWINNGAEKLYGPESDVLYAVPQPRITSTDSDLKINSINLKWKKVKGATKYDVYISTKQKSGYKKVATVKGSKKSCKITKYKGKTINLLNRYYYVKVVTYAKFGKKTVKSQNNCQVRARVRKFYY